jgi:hypothetical protein
VTEQGDKKWYERQRQRDAESRALSESLLGPEKAMFAEFMGLTAGCLDAVFWSGRFEDLASKRKIEFGNHAFNLLWSAWDEALCGRYDASRAHFRSIGECRDFLMALIADPLLADRLGDRTKDIYLARRRIRDTLDQGKAGAGKAFFECLKKAADDVQELSHVCHNAAAGALPVIEKDGETVGVVRPGGTVSAVTLRLLAVQLALDAALLFGVLSAGFIDVTELDDEVWRSAIRRAEHLARELGSELEGIRATVKGPISQLYFARSDEEL